VTRPPVGRLAALFVVIVFAMVGIVLRLGMLQVRESHQYRNLALDQRERTVTLEATRGAILDRSHEDLAMSLQARDVYADGRFVQDPLAVAQKIAPILHEKAHTLMPALSSPSSFSYVARGVPMGQADRIEALHLPGLGFLDSTRRFYPAGALAPQVLGYVGTDGTGLAGLELQYNSILSGRRSPRRSTATDSRSPGASPPTSRRSRARASSRRSTATSSTRCRRRSSAPCRPTTRRAAR